MEGVGRGGATEHDKNKTKAKQFGIYVPDLPIMDFLHMHIKLFLKSRHFRRKDENGQFHLARFWPNFLFVVEIFYRFKWYQNQNCCNSFEVKP